MFCLAESNKVNHSHNPTRSCKHKADFISFPKILEHFSVVKELDKHGARIFILDKLSVSDLILAYESADAFILPTHGEGWGRPIMEAMASGKVDVNA